MDKKNRRQTALQKELQAVEKQERKLEKAALKTKPAFWKTELERRIPAKVYSGLLSAFGRSFSLVFQQGRSLIEKTYNKENIQADHVVRDFAVQLKGGRKELKNMHKSAKQADLLNLAVTTVEGVGLGALGISMPDVMLFLSTLLKGIYESALNFGFDYESRQAQMLILQMIETALTAGEDWSRKNADVDAAFACGPSEISEEDFQKQIHKTSSAFAVDMMVLKFIQGIPVVGILGGAANPVYYSKILKYVQLKYRKHYLLKQKN